MNEKQEAALHRLFNVAQVGTGQGRKVAGFLLSWWNSDTCGGFDVTDLWAVDASIANDIVLVIGVINEVHSYPDTLGYEAVFESLVKQWRPHLFLSNEGVH